MALATRDDAPQRPATPMLCQKKSLSLHRDGLLLRCHGTGVVVVVALRGRQRGRRRRGERHTLQLSCGCELRDKIASGAGKYEYPGGGRRPFCGAGKSKHTSTYFQKNEISCVGGVAESAAGVRIARVRETAKWPLPSIPDSPSTGRGPAPVSGGSRKVTKTS